MSYQPIENYGIIGDLHTVALIGVNGSIDWLCFPKFNSPSIFGALLDDEKGGRFSIAPGRKNTTLKQFYWPETNVLITRSLSDEGIGEITDYMPIDEPGHWRGRHQLIRQVCAVRGNMPFKLECRPAFNHGRDRHEVYQCRDGVSFRSPALNVGLSTNTPLRPDGNGGVIGEFTLHEGENAIFVLEQLAPDSECSQAISAEEAERLFNATVRYWRRWIAKCTYKGRWREMVHRSALVLKLLTYEPTGAIVAAPTCSLPEHLGGSRNWDYRYTWIRDAAFTLYALMRIGFTQEASRFIEWLEARCHELDPNGSIQIMYGIEGRHDLVEQDLDHLEGYRGSRPVRIGNAAFQQPQLDIYGELMDSVYLYNKYGTPISFGFWKELSRLLDWVCAHWQEADYGIWEVRGEPRQFVYSKLMCWVALDRGLRIAAHRSFPARRDRWIEARDEIYEDLLKNGWNDEVGAFVQYYGSRALDASNLLMPLVFFVSPSDPKILSTIDAIQRSTSKGGLMAGSLVYRYQTKKGVDGLDGDEGTFNMCTFWLVEALTRAGRTDPKRLEDARLIFERMLGYASHLGLYAEETGPRGEALGNFPQALTHLALITAACNLDRALDGDDAGWPGVVGGGPGEGGGNE